MRMSTLFASLWWLKLLAWLTRGPLTTFTQFWFAVVEWATGISATTVGFSQATFPFIKVIHIYVSLDLLCCLRNLLDHLFDNLLNNFHFFYFFHWRRFQGFLTCLRFRSFLRWCFLSRRHFAFALEGICKLLLKILNLIFSINLECFHLLFKFFEFLLFGLDSIFVSLRLTVQLTDSLQIWFDLFAVLRLQLRQFFDLRLHLLLIWPQLFQFLIFVLGSTHVIFSFHLVYFDFSVGLNELLRSIF